MAAIHEIHTPASAVLPEQPQTKPVSAERMGAITKLARLHAEAEETARLANLLGRSVYVAILLPVLAILTVGLSGMSELNRQIVWIGFVAAVSLGIGTAYAHAMRRPFERDALRDFAKDLSAILLFAGFAWGAGAFLALPAGLATMAAVAFVAVPAIAVAALLREREAVFLFLAPVATLSAFASVLRPSTVGALDAGLIVLTSAAIAVTAAFADPRRTHDTPAMLPLK